MTEIKGWHVATVFVLAFGVIISVNLTLAYSAVKTFPGLEVKNSYVASQAFDRNRAAQEALGWDVRAWTDGDTLRLTLMSDGAPVQARIDKAVLGRATHVAEDIEPEFAWDGSGYAAPVSIDRGNWNLRLKARASDGTLFEQRIIVDTRS